MNRDIPVLTPLTVDARRALPGGRPAALVSWPFRVGRECRGARLSNAGIGDERRRSLLPINNELYLWDPGPHFNVSREHFLVERDHNGRFLLRHRGGPCATLVGNHTLGPGERTCWPLSVDQVIVVGGPGSPFVFRFGLIDRATLTDNAAGAGSRINRGATTGYPQSAPALHSETASD